MFNKSNREQQIVDLFSFFFFGTAYCSLPIDCLVLAEGYTIHIIYIGVPT